MKIHYDPTADRLSFYLSSASPASFEEVREDLCLLLDADGRLVGLEVRNARKRADLTDLGVVSRSELPVSAALTPVTIFTDGACLKNPGPGGWAARLKYSDGRVIEIGGADPHTTSNRMELFAAIQGLEEAGEAPAVTLVTDSEYLRKGITHWIRSWKRNNWKTAAKKPVLNQDLWYRLDQLNGPHVTWIYTRGHAGDPDNERCNQLAQAFARGQQPELMR